MSCYQQDPPKPTVHPCKSTHSFANLISQHRHHLEVFYPKHPFDTITRNCPHSSTQRYATHSITAATNYNPTGPGHQHSSTGTTDNVPTPPMDPTPSAPVQVPQGTHATYSIMAATDYNPTGPGPRCGSTNTNDNALTPSRDPTASAATPEAVPSVGVAEAVSTLNAASECAPKTKLKKVALMWPGTTKTAR